MTGSERDNDGKVNRPVQAGEADQDDGFLSRWMRRKQEARDGADGSDQLDEVGSDQEPAGVDGGLDTSAPESADQPVDLEQLPDPETMSAGDDFSVFMNPAVPTALRNRALRKLWRLNPMLANVDGLVDYGEDFTDAATVVANLETAYRVGRGFLRPDEETADETGVPEADEAEFTQADGVDDDADGATSHAEAPATETDLTASDDPTDTQSEEHSAEPQVVENPDRSNPESDQIPMQRSRRVGVRFFVDDPA